MTKQLAYMKKVLNAIFAAGIAWGIMNEKVIAKDLCRCSLDNHLGGHEGVDGAEIGVGPRCAERVRELSVGLNGGRGEAIIRRRDGVLHVVVVGPDDRSTRRYGNGRRDDVEVLHAD